MRELGSVIGFSAFLGFLAFLPEFFLSIEGALTAFLLLYFGFYNFIQEEQAFCGTFGVIGLHRGSEGLERTSDEEDRSQDLRKSLRQNSAALGLTALFISWSLLLFSL